MSTLATLVGQALQTLTVADVPEGFDFVSDSQDVAPLREYFADAREFDSFFVRVENCAYVGGFGMRGVVPHLSRRVYPLQARDASQTSPESALLQRAADAQTRYWSLLSELESLLGVEIDGTQDLAGVDLADLLAADVDSTDSDDDGGRTAAGNEYQTDSDSDEDDDDAALVAERHEEILAGLVGRVEHSRIREANGRSVRWTYTGTGGMLDVYSTE